MCVCVCVCVCVRERVCERDRHSVCVRETDTTLVYYTVASRQQYNVLQYNILTISSSIIILLTETETWSWIQHMCAIFRIFVQS